LIQGFLLEEALGEWIGLTDEEWALIGRCCPPGAGAAAGWRRTTAATSKA